MVIKNDSKSHATSTPLAGQSKIILDFGCVYMVSVLYLADQNLAEGPFGFWIFHFAIFAKFGFFRDVEI